MSSIRESDPRDVLVRDKYFSLRPRPLERWLWSQNLPSSAERVFWIHWAAGMQNGDWCSELSLRQVATECRIDTSTVTRAYQLLCRLGLIKREDPGRDEQRPFQQAISITEVRVPHELLVQLSREPNRHRAPPPSAALASTPAPQPAPSPRTTETPRLSRGESKALLQKLSAAEIAAFYRASRERGTHMSFDDPGVLSPDERGQVLAILAAVSAEKPTQPTASVPRAPSKTFARVRKFSPLETARLRKSILQLVSSSAAQEVFIQVLWSVEEGALRQFAPALATNIALKKIREGLWMRPYRMPPNWMRGASHETCTAA
jgi:hypothetical protein